MNNRVTKKRVLVTGGAGFIGSNLVDDFLLHDNFVVCLDDFSTGKRENIAHLNDHPNFLLVEGDIRNLDDCKKACAGVDIVLHHAALGSVPRSMEDPITTNEVNISGFLNMLVAARDASVKRFVYACSSSTYGDSTALPKVEDKIGKPLSPYAITKYVNELYADVFANLYAMQLIGLRYFNIFGRRQDPFSTYSAVIPKFVSALINYKPITINGDGSFSRDFTYIENVVLANHLAATTQNPEAINQVYNVACGERTTLNQMVEALIEFMSEYDPKIKNAEVIYGLNRKGDVPHSLASIDKIQTKMNYQPLYSFKEGLKASCKWYWENLQKPE
ncbi:MAG: SDR family oxidoreductase [Bacteroidales bacterium]|nr:SDR family oxidoreductase [Bacteroidales bacterium]